MTRQEFLRELQLALQGQLSQAAIQENIRYYDGYIKEEVRKGSSEEAVTSRLGNPRLIAKTLIDTTDQFGRAASGGGFSDGYGAKGNDKDARFDSSSNRGFHIRLGGLQLNSWFGRLLLIALAALAIVVVANVVAFLLPVLVPVILVLLICSLIFGSRR